MASQWHKALNDAVPAAQEQHHYMQTAAFWSQSSLSWDLEQKWAGVGVTPPATPTANTSHLTARTGCAFAVSFMQICTCTHLSKNKHAHRHQKQLQAHGGFICWVCERLCTTYVHTPSFKSCLDWTIWHKNVRVASVYFCPEVFCVQHLLQRTFLFLKSSVPRNHSCHITIIVPRTQTTTTTWIIYGFVFSIECSYSCLNSL